MIRACFVRRTSAFAIAFGLFASLPPAMASDAKVEASAKKLQTDAMDTDFLGLDFKKAKKKLDDAIKKCGKDKCAKPLVATLQRDLGIVLINSGDSGAGAKAFGAAFAADPNVAIAKDFLDNGDVKKAWETAKKKKGSEDTPAVPDPPVSSADGGLSVKTTLAPLGYELPIVISAPAGLEVASVKVSYKTEAMEKYRAVDAKKQSGKWVVILPCDVVSKSGVIKLFAKAYDDGNAEIDHWGTIKKPAQIKLVDGMPDDAESPTLPGGKEPKECKEGGGGGGDGGGEEGPKSGTKPEGSGCKDDDECEKGLVCVENDAGKKWCQPGEKKPKVEYKRIWIGFDGAWDMVSLGKDGDLCKKSDVWACSADSGAHFDSTTGEITSLGRQDITTSSNGIRVGETGGKTDGGMAFATKRVMLSIDGFVSPRLSIGGRLGFAFGANPTSEHKRFMGQAELRLQYFISDGVFRPYFLGAFGYGPIDAPVPNVIVEPQDPAYANACNQGGDPYEDPPCGGGNSRPVIKNVTAYKLVGPFYGGVGVGSWIMVSDGVAVNLAVKFLFPLPNFSPTLAPEIGMKFGF